MALTANDEIILSFFERAKEEVYVRIRLRDTLLAAYTTTVAATFGFARATSAFANPGASESSGALLILPYLGFAFTLLVSYHHLCIATLGAYIKFELRKNIDAQTIVHVFDGWNRFTSHRSGAQRLRSVGQAIILLTPPLMGLAINLQTAVSSSWTSVLYFWFGAIATASSLAVILRTYFGQRDLQANDERLHNRRRTDFASLSTSDASTPPKRDA